MFINFYGVGLGFLDKNGQGIFVTFPQMGAFEIVFMNKVGFLLEKMIISVFSLENIQQIDSGDLAELPEDRG